MGRRAPPLALFLLTVKPEMGGLHSGTVRVILGRKSLTSQGFIVPPGIIDEDFKGEIQIMTYVKKKKKQMIGLIGCDRIAQLLLFSCIKCKTLP